MTVAAKTGGKDPVVPEPLKHQREADDCLVGDDARGKNAALAELSRAIVENKDQESNRITFLQNNFGDLKRLC